MKNLYVILVLTASVTSARAQQPKTVNTKLHVEAATASLSATIERLRQSDQLLWIGYEFPALPGAHVSSCGGWRHSSSAEDQCCGEYSLEDAAGSWGASDHEASSTQDLYVLLRYDHGAISRVRVASAACTLNAGGLPVDWVTGANPEESATLLAQVAAKAAENTTVKQDYVVDGSLSALAQHETSKATGLLLSLASPPHNSYLREKAAFWLGAARGHAGYEALLQLVAREQDPKLREKLAFDFSVNKDPSSSDALVRMAKSDGDSGVRGQALFWLAQKAGNKAVASLRDSAEHDPDTEVKKKAVFALSQLPQEESVTQLIQVADTNTNPEVRKQAIFWLGQTKDPRALAYFEEVLKR